MQDILILGIAGLMAYLFLQKQKQVPVTATPNSPISLTPQAIATIIGGSGGTIDNTMPLDKTLISVIQPDFTAAVNPFVSDENLQIDSYRQEYPYAPGVVDVSGNVIQ